MSTVELEIFSHFIVRESLLRLRWESNGSLEMFIKLIILLPCCTECRDDNISEWK